MYYKYVDIAIQAVLKRQYTIIILYEDINIMFCTYLLYIFPTYDEQVSNDVFYCETNFTLLI